MFEIGLAELSSRAQALPPTTGIADPHIRRWAEAMNSAWATRNGGGGDDNERFVLRKEIYAMSADTVVRLLTGAASADVASLQANPSGVYSQMVRAVSGLVTSSRAYEYLRTPNQLLAPPDSSKIADLIRRVNALVPFDSTPVYAAITAEQNARTTADSAEVTTRELLATQVRGSYTGTSSAAVSSGLIFSERTARATADSAMATDISALTSRVGTSEADIVTERSTRASADSSAASLTSALTTRVTNSESNISNELSTRSNKDNSLAQAVNTIWATIGGAQALIQDSSLASVSPAAVSATKWLQVQAAVTDPNTGLVNSASIKFELNAYASKVDGTLNTTFGIKANTNGVVTGVALATSAGAGSAAGTATSSFLVMADRFSLVSPTNNSLTPVPFSVDSSGNAVFTGSVYAAAGVFGGSLSAASGTFAGSLSAASGTFSGTLTAQSVNTNNIVGAAITSVFSSTTSTLRTTLVMSVPSGARSLVVMAFYGGGELITGVGSGKDAYSLHYYGPIYGTLSGDNVASDSSFGVSCIAITDPVAGIYNFAADRSQASVRNIGLMRLVILLTKR